MPRVAFHTLGCKLNFAETSTIARDFTDHGFEVVPFGSQAEITVINTCTVTDEADRKCRRVIRRAVKASPEGFVAVTGCFAQLRPQDVAGIPGVDLVLGTHEKFRLFDLVDGFEKGQQTQVAVSCIDDGGTFGPAWSSGDRTRAFLKVQDGCDYSCSFCTIPLARGPSRSQTISRCVAQARTLADEGYREIVLSGVNIGLFGQENGETFQDLIRALDGVEGIMRYRISSIEPNLLTDSIIDFVAASRAFVPHFHIPLQSGDDYVLGRMRRRYRAERYASRVEHIKEAMPHACIGVDVIVGFPAEDTVRFENTARFLTDLPISYLHVFTYSERANTVAVEQVANDEATPVPFPERARRNKVLQALSERKRHAFYQEHRGTERAVLWEQPDENGQVTGWTDNYIRVVHPPGPEPASHRGTIEKVHLGAFSPEGYLRVSSRG